RLRRRFGAAFETYAARVPRFWPRLGRAGGGGPPFSWRLYSRNGEWQAAVGFAEGGLRRVPGPRVGWGGAALPGPYVRPPRRPRRAARLVVTRRMDYVPAGGPYVRFLYRRAVDGVIAISDGVRAALVRVGVRAERIRVVPSGIDAGAFAAPPGARASVRREWRL